MNSNFLSRLLSVGANVASSVRETATKPLSDVEASVFGMISGDVSLMRLLLGLYGSTLTVSLVLLGVFVLLASLCTLPDTGLLTLQASIEFIEQLVELLVGGLLGTSVIGVLTGRSSSREMRKVARLTRRQVKKQN